MGILLVVNIVIAAVLMWMYGVVIRDYITKRHDHIHEMIRQSQMPRWARTLNSA